MADRPVHLVGTYPGDSTREAMSEVAGKAGKRLMTLPDCEVGDRNSWIIPIMEGFRENPGIEIAKNGDYSDYSKLPRFKISRELDPSSLGFTQVDDAKIGYAELARLRQETGLELGFQASVPGDFDMALFSLGPIGALRHRSLFRRAIGEEIRGISSIAGDDVVIQLDLPAELVMVASMPPPLRPIVARMMARGIARLAREAEYGTRFGAHLCVGDLNHKALRQLSSAAPIVSMALALLDQWPDGRSLEYIHLPLAAGDSPPSTDPAFYEPLSRLSGLDTSTRLIAGLAHEGQDEGTQVSLLRMVEERLQCTVGVSSACGLGRRDKSSAAKVLERAAILADSE